MQPGAASYFARAQEIECARISRIRHPVILVKRGHVPWDVDGNTRDEAGQITQLLLGIVKSRHEQRDNLYPDARLKQTPDRIENGLQPSAEFAVLPVAETLQVNLVKIDPGPKVFENFRRAVAVGYEPRHQTGLSSLPEDRHPPLRGYQGLVVRAHNDVGALGERQLHELPGRRLLRRRNGGRIAKRLGRDPVLAVTAVEVASEHAEAEGERPGARVEERFLLDGIALNAADVPEGHPESSSAVEPDLAYARRSIGNRAPMTTRVAPYPFSLQPIVKLTLYGLFREYLRQ
jgi:hypothetical protein